MRRWSGQRKVGFWLGYGFESVYCSRFVSECCVASCPALLVANHSDLGCIAPGYVIVGLSETTVLVDE